MRKHETNDIHDLTALDEMEQLNLAEDDLKRKTRHSARRAATRRYKRRMNQIADRYDSARRYQYYRPYRKHGHVAIANRGDASQFIKLQTHRRMRNTPVPNEDEWESAPSTNGNFCHKNYRDYTGTYSYKL